MDRATSKAVSQARDKAKEKKGNKKVNTKMIKIFFLAVISTCVMVAQSDDDSKLVTVPKKYVSSEGLNHQEKIGNIGQWAGIGREIGIATKEGLNNAVEVADKFGATKVGNFILLMVAWKIIGYQLFKLVIGIPLSIGGICVWMWVLRRFFIGYRVLDKIEGKTKFYKLQSPYKFDSSEAKGAVGVALLAAMAAWTFAFMMVIFS